MQSVGGNSSTTTNAALTADLDWGVTLRAEALAGGKRIGKSWRESAMAERHIWYKDMAPGGSSALVADVTGAVQAVAAQPSAIKVRMPTCYPYTSPVYYRVTWSVGATTAAHAACQWQQARALQRSIRPRSRADPHLAIQVRIRSRFSL